MPPCKQNFHDSTTAIYIIYILKDLLYTNLIILEYNSYIASLYNWLIDAAGEVPGKGYH